MNYYDPTREKGGPMSTSRLKYLTICASAAMMACASAPAFAQTISVGVTPSFAETLGDIGGSFNNYYIENGGFSYNVAYERAPDADIKANIISGGAGGPYDLFLSQDEKAIRDLKAKYPALVIGHPFPFAVGTLDLYSGLANPVNISKGLPWGWWTKDIVIPDPKADAYGKAAWQVLSATPGFKIALRNGKIQIRDDVGTAFAAIDEGNFGYGFVAKSQICKNWGGTTESYIDGTYHHEYRPSGYGSGAIVLYGIKIARTRTEAQDTELALFIDFLTGKGDSTLGTEIVEQYCYKLPDRRNYYNWYQHYLSYQDYTWYKQYLWIKSRYGFKHR